MLLEGDRQRAELAVQRHYRVYLRTVVFRQR